MPVDPLIILLLAVGGIAAVLLLVGIAIGLIPAAAFIYIWRSVYPWLLRMGRWAAQLRNLIFLLAILLVIGLVSGILAAQVTGTTPLLIVVTLIFMAPFAFFLLLAVVVWLVRLWRWAWPPWRLGFWDICARILGVLWLILVGILMGISWLFYHPLRWLVATLLFYLRLISAAAAWLLYHPPLTWLVTADLFVMQLIARPTAWVLYNPPIRWVAEAVICILRLITRILSVVIYGILSLLIRIVNGVNEAIRGGLAAEKNSYHEYKYAHHGHTGAA